MSKCSICHKNEAIWWSQNLGDGEVSEQPRGICLRCAYEKKIQEIMPYLETLGVNDSNVDFYTAQMNQTMKQLHQLKDSGELEQLLQNMPAFFQGPNGAILGLNLSGTPSETFEKDREKPAGSPVVEEVAEVQDQSSTGNTESTEEEDPLGAQRVQDVLSYVRNLFGAGEEGPVPAHALGEGGDEEDGSGGKKTRTKTKRKSKRKFLDQFGTNLTDKAKAGKLDCLVGRDEELNRVIQILNRRTKNNPVLLGEPGVGKTAIAEGLALRIARAEVPLKLRKMEVYLLDMTGMVAGTQFRGQFEARMKGVVEEACQEGNIILVVDELHNIVGAGDAEGAMNAANILKPALASGSLRLVGSTTLNEYRRYIEKDSALERRFQQVRVEEPNLEDSLEILRGIKGYYEEHHHVRYSDEVLEATIRYADRYLHDRFFPDKAIDLLDEAGSKANLGQKQLVRTEEIQQAIQSIGEEIEQLQNQVNTLQNDQARIEIYEKLAERQKQKVQLVEEQDKLKPQLEPVAVTKENIAAVVELWTGIPVQAITEGETERLLDLENRLHQRVVGQEEAIRAISRAIRRNRAGFGRRHKPASFLFVGPTGVGKTELVKALTEVLFQDEKALIRMDMSEFMDSHTSSKLIGSPPGYVGFDEGGQLTEKVRRHPYSVILFDEIEKAHPDIFNLLLQILDDGRLTDSHGRIVNFENTVIILTSNVGTSTRSTTIGFGQEIEAARKDQIQKALREVFRPEFLNRLDETVVFQALTQEELQSICDLMLREVQSALDPYGLRLSLAPEAKAFLIQKGYSLQYGARPLRRMIRRYVEEPLAEDSLKGAFRGKHLVQITHEAGTDHLHLNYRTEEESNSAD